MLLTLAAPSASAAALTAQIDGVEGAVKDAVVAASGLTQYADRDVTAAQVQRLYAAAPAKIAAALEPYGYYNAKVHGDLQQTPAGWIAILHVAPGEPTTVAAFDLALPDPARDEKVVRQALATFVPKQGQPLDHAAYEKSKAAVQTALLASGYLDASLATHRVDVSRADNRAAIKLAWDPGQRYRYGATTFSGGQFTSGFLDRYLPWHEGDFYTQSQLLQLQQRLIDADYFAIVEVQPDMEHAHAGIVPIKVTLGPAKRNVYTAGIFIDTDIGFGVRGGLTRRWLNTHGHKLKLEAQIAQRLKSAAATYSIPLPGDNNRSYNFGVNYLDENTETTLSHTSSLVVNETRDWMGFTRTLGLHLLTGDFTILDPNGDTALEQRGTTTLLYPELDLERKQADDPLFVRDGYSLTLAVRGSPGVVSATSFLQARADAKWIRGIGQRQRIILRGSLGASTVGDFDKLPPDLRFFAGGDRSIRGYTFQTIGPHTADGLVVGGRDLAVGSAEYEYYFSRNWGIATFVDAGDAFSGFGNFQTHIGTGLGLRWRSPVGMVRADLGVPVHDPDGQTGVALHLVIGPDL
ncbi:MAG: outer membrane protein assembly factor [Rudaea sp.]|nr:outer membrane protein assembly factor [Rudaea sp.]